MTTQEQLDLDLRLYGCSYERLKEDGTIERIDPTTIRIRQLRDDNKFYPRFVELPSDFKSIDLTNH